MVMHSARHPSNARTPGTRRTEFVNEQTTQTQPVNKAKANHAVMNTMSQSAYKLTLKRGRNSHHASRLFTRAKLIPRFWTPDENVSLETGSLTPVSVRPRTSRFPLEKRQIVFAPSAICPWDVRRRARAALRLSARVPGAGGEGERERNAERGCYARSRARLSFAFKPHVVLARWRCALDGTRRHTAR